MDFFNPIYADPVLYHYMYLIIVSQISLVSNPSFQKAAPASLFSCISFSTFGKVGRSLHPRAMFLDIVMHEVEVLVADIDLVVG